MRSSPRRPAPTVSTPTRRSTSRSSTRTSYRKEKYPAWKSSTRTPCGSIPIDLLLLLPRLRHPLLLHRHHHPQQQHLRDIHDLRRPVRLLVEAMVATVGTTTTTTTTTTTPRTITTTVSRKAVVTRWGCRPVAGRGECRPLLRLLPDLICLLTRLRADSDVDLVEAVVVVMTSSTMYLRIGSRSVVRTALSARWRTRCTTWVGDRPSTCPLPTSRRRAGAKSWRTGCRRC